MITISILPLAIILLLVHTIFTHLLGWWIRKEGSDEIILIITLLFIVEIIICIGILCEILK